MNKDQQQRLISETDISCAKLATYFDTPDVPVTADIVRNWKYGRTSIPDNIIKQLRDITFAHNKVKSATQR